RRVIVEGGTVHLAGDDVLAGSVLTMDQAVRNLIAFTGCSLAEAAVAAARTPARLLGLEGRKGSLAPGCDADIVVLDEDLKVALTIVRGRIVYEAEN
ncbi:MAG TPA: N-acetylglucosamine-6-phosphate deacetylase, partial [Anaerolineae bacterium]|nr:N-acetylglucosamine-6-phosphate deacetylase [Anaerolineae bacterium]